ncbi:MAG: HD-GYP domain-containing protein, partial [Phycisphaerales bacterium]|nr:HD-GYP domain-containing protein [Phycisphaerales bacterium]
HGVPRLSRPEADRVLASLETASADLLEASDSSQAMHEYCSYLTRSYENMAMVYRLVRSLGKIGSAREVVQQSLGNMVETLECDWAAAVFGDEPHLLGELSGEVFSACHNGATGDAAGEAGALIKRHGLDGNRVVAPEDNGGVGAVIQPIRMRSTDVGRLVMAGKRSDEGDVSSFDTQLIEAVAACIGSLLETIKLYEEQAATFMGTLRAFSSSLDAKDPYTRGHSERVALLGRQLALALGMSADEAERVHLAGVLHDIGKIGIPDRVLCKPGRLTDDEFGLIKRHPRTGHDILKPIPTVRDLLPGVLSHHERWDGRGYPDGLSGEGIPVMARILAIADTFDAMSSNRAYRPARGRDEVLAEIEKCAGSQFDPAMAPVFLSMDLAPFDEMLARHI